MASARFGRLGIGDENLSLYYRTTRIRLTDNVTNRFLGGDFQRAMRGVHEAAAIKVQEGMVEYLDEKVRLNNRNQKGGRYLARSILDDRNRDANASDFVVGRPAWLDKSYAADYWRRIEEGGPGFTTTALFTNGLPRSGRQKLYGPWASGGGTRPQPMGYRHRRMPQGIGPIITVKAQEPYSYMRAGGRRAYAAMDMYDRYNIALAAIGIPISRVTRIGKK